MYNKVANILTIPPVIQFFADLAGILLPIIYSLFFSYCSGYFKSMLFHFDPFVFLYTNEVTTNTSYFITLMNAIVTLNSALPAMP
jgi:hypothetical protein